MTGSVRKLIVVSLVLIAAAYGCGNPLDSSPANGSGYIPAPLGMEFCYNCHAGDAFKEWLTSRHANFSVGYFPPVDPFTMKDVFGAPRTYDEITGGPDMPDPLDSSDYRWGCLPCHNGEAIQGDNGGWILDTQTYGVLFPDPNLGEIARPVIDCEACHISGAGHFGGSSPPYVQVPAFHECTRCHPPTDSMLSLDAFAQAERTDHHDPSSTHAWSYAGTNSSYIGSAIGDLLAFNDPSPIETATRILNSETFEAYVISATWMSNNTTNWHFDTHHTINDTHYQDIWVTDVPDEVVVFTSPTSKFGYVDLSNSSPNTGMVRADSVDSCTASCHDAHEFDLTRNEQWFDGAHHPNIEGPLGTDGADVVPAGPNNWGAVNHGFGANCLRCHTAMGFAEVAPGYGDAVQTPAGQSDGFITCNACHNGVDYPEPGNPGLRFYQVSLYDFQGGVIRPVNSAGNSAVCIYCHQGREDASHVDSDIAAGTPRFRDMHHLPAAAMLFAEKGYKYPGKSYVGAQAYHSLVGCTSCHMADDPISSEVGGHTFLPSRGTTEATTFCKTCHPAMTGFNDPVDHAHISDWDGSPGTISARDEVAYLLTVLLHNAIEAYDSSGDVDTLANIKYLGHYPYFGTTDSTQGWDAPLAKATFNWQFVNSEPGAFVHNPKYAVQLLRDSYEDLAANQDTGATAILPLGGVRP